jgi:hypothetical protein
MEIQNDNSIPFLDILIFGLLVGSLTYQVYRKKTHTNRYLHVDSHHHPNKKSIVLKTLITRVVRISTPQFLEKEKTHITKALMSNGSSISHRIKPLDRMQGSP